MSGLRWVDRGPEPERVTCYAQQYTQGWVDYFQNAIGERPTDSHWGEFRSALGSITNNICWYCERQTQAVGGWAPTVDHFRPRSRFPHLVYVWSNWVYSCQRCNVEYKKDKWPESGYVDPCAADIAERPEQYFDYDEVSGGIVPNKGLSETAERRARGTITDFGLNKWDLLKPRFVSIRRFTEELVEELLDLPTADRQAFIADFLALTTAGRLAFLAFIASLKEQPAEYTGLKEIVAGRLLRERPI